MFRILLFLAIIMGALNAVAQVGITPIRTAVKPTDEALDYKQMGAPMPPLKYIKFPDSNYKKVVVEVAKLDTGAPADKQPKKKRKHKKDVAMIPNGIAEAPKYLTNQDFDNGANLFVMMFNPTCSHCEDETQLLEKNIFLFKRSKIILMANPVMWEYMPNFVKSFHIDEYTTISVGVDSSDFINKVFLYSSLPQINIYDHNRKLLKTYAGEVPIDSLKAFIE
jgi:hypothetical protein